MLAEGTTFLLPLLLQVTEPGYAAGTAAEHQLWCQALGEPAVLSHLVRYAWQCATVCAPAVTTAAAAAADDALLYACQLLLNVAVGDEGEEGAAAAGSAGGTAPGLELGAARLGLLAAPDTPSLLRALLKLAQLRPVAPPPDCSPDQALQAAR